VERLKETKNDTRITGLLFGIHTRNLSSKEEQRQPLNSDIPQTFYYFLKSPSGIICADIFTCTFTAGCTNLPCTIIYRVKLTAGCTNLPCTIIYRVKLTAGCTNLPCTIIYRVKLTAAPVTIQFVLAHLCCSDPSKKFVQIRDLA